MGANDIVQIITTLFVIFGNTSLITVFALTKRIQTSTNIFIIVVATSDLLVSLVLAATRRTLGRRSIDHGSNLVCTTAGTCMYVTFFVSFFGQTAIATNRYVKICWPNAYSRIFNRRNVILITVGIWLFSLVLVVGSATLGWVVYSYDERVKLCSIDRRYPTFAVIMIIVGVLVPSFINLGLYTMVIRKIRKSGPAVSKPRPPANTSSSTTNRTKYGRRAQSGNVDTVFRSSKRLNAKTRAVAVLLLAFVVYVILFYPVAGAIIADFYTTADLDEVLTWTMLMAYAGCATNPIIYGFLNTNIKNAYKNCFRRCCCRCRCCPGYIVHEEPSSERTTNDTVSTSL
ncbi:melatonin receptor type 1B-like [Tubulanus polymorphus]|uniref:melatonin receptor type 1B-like n=1 Tax=Tubulanus polymorphus TaxID=672921 RepID=UPI003DA38922